MYWPGSRGSAEGLATSSSRGRDGRWLSETTRLLKM